jgi:ABC-2 type transport system permease protein
MSRLKGAVVNRLESWQWQFCVIRQYVAMNVMQTLEYRGAFFIYMFDTVVGPLISLLVWLAVSDQGVRLPYDRAQFVTYYVLLGLVSMLTGTWIARYLARAIRLGTLSPWLLRPAPYLAHQIGNNLGEKVIKLALLLPMVALAALAFRADLRLPAEPARWALFAVALPLAAAVAFLLDVVVGSLAFWIHDVGGPSSLLDIARSFLDGRYVPLALFPPWLGGFLEAQPFRYTLSFPLEVLTGSLTPEALARGFAWQTGYVVGLWALYKVLWRYGLRVYSASGA